MAGKQRPDPAPSSPALAAGSPARPSAVRLALLWAPVLAQMAAIFAVSSIPDPGAIPGGVPAPAAHVLAYALLSGLLVRALSAGRWDKVTPRVVAIAVIVSTIYGISDEWHQSFVPGRTPEAADVLADMAGALVMALALWAWSIIRIRPAARARNRAAP